MISTRKQFRLMFWAVSAEWQVVKQRTKYRKQSSVQCNVAVNAGAMLVAEQATSQFHQLRSHRFFDEDISIDSMDICAQCRKVGSKHCNRCFCVTYCSKPCQQTHWTAVHKYECNTTSEEMSGESLFDQGLTILRHAQHKHEKHTAKHQEARLHSKDDLHGRMYEAAAVKFEQACGKGHTRANINLAWLYDQGCGNLENRGQEVVKLLEGAAEAGYGKAQHNLGDLYSTGRHVVQDLERARELFSAAAENGVVIAFKTWFKHGSISLIQGSCEKRRCQGSI